MRYLIIFTLIIFSLSLSAQVSISPKYNQDSLNAIAIKSYEICLLHENDGVVESAIGNVLRFKFRHPDTNLDSIQTLLLEISQLHPTKIIREKALLVSNILGDQSLVTEIGKNFYKDIHQFLNMMVASRNFKSTNIKIISRNESENIEIRIEQ